MSIERSAVQCSTCGVSVLAKNMARHRREVHKLMTNPPTPARSVALDGTFMSQARSRSTSREINRTSTASHSGSSDSGVSPASRYNCIDELEKAGLDLAASKLLVQHHMFTEPRLVKFLEDNFPNVKPEERRALVIGAAAGARYAAMSYFTVQGNQHSPDPAKRLMAMNAHSELTFWNRGLSDEAYTPPASVPLESTVNDVNGEGEFVVPLANSSTLHAVDLADLQLPVSMDALRQEFDAVTASIMAAGIPNGAPEFLPVGDVRPPLSSSLESIATVTSKNMTDVETAPEHRQSVESADEPYVPSQTSVTVASTSYKPTPLHQLATKETSGATPSVTTDLTTVARSSPIASFEPISADGHGIGGPPSCADTLERDRPPTTNRTPRRHASRSPRRRRTPSRHSSPRGRWVSEREFYNLQRFKSAKGWRR